MASVVRRQSANDHDAPFIDGGPEAARILRGLGPLKVTMAGLGLELGLASESGLQIGPSSCQWRVHEHRTAAAGGASY